MADRPDLMHHFADLPVASVATAIFDHGLRAGMAIKLHNGKRRAMRLSAMPDAIAHLRQWAKGEA